MRDKGRWVRHFASRVRLPHSIKNSRFVNARISMSERTGKIPWWLSTYAIATCKNHLPLRWDLDADIIASTSIGPAIRTGLEASREQAEPLTQHGNHWESHNSETLNDFASRMEVMTKEACSALAKAAYTWPNSMISTVGKHHCMWSETMAQQ